MSTFHMSSSLCCVPNAASEFAKPRGAGLGGQPLSAPAHGWHSCRRRPPAALAWPSQTQLVLLACAGGAAGAGPRALGLACGPVCPGGLAVSQWVVDSSGWVSRAPLQPLLSSWLCWLLKGLGGSQCSSPSCSLSADWRQQAILSLQTYLLVPKHHPVCSLPLSSVLSLVSSLQPPAPLDFTLPSIRLPRALTRSAQHSGSPQPTCPPPPLLTSGPRPHFLPASISCLPRPHRVIAPFQPPLPISVSCVLSWAAPSQLPVQCTGGPRCSLFCLAGESSEPSALLS